MGGFDRQLLREGLRRPHTPILRGLIEALKQDPDAESVLAALSEDRDYEVRGWAAGVAAEVVGRAALPWLAKMARSDRNTENRALALQELVDMDPEAARPLVPQLRLRLKRVKDPDEFLDAARALTFLRDRESLPFMRARVEEWGPTLGYARMLGTYILALEGRGDVILQRIREHDHISVGWLAFAASRFVRTAEARATLEWGAHNLPDEECRNRCMRFLAEGRWLPA